jgi:hypothetical protein
MQLCQDQPARSMDDSERARLRLGAVAKKRWHGRFENWALYYEGSRGHFGDSVLGTAEERSKTYGENVPEARFARLYEQTTPQPLVGEATDTASFIARLPQDIQFALIATYRRSGTLEFRAAELGIHVNTLRNRVEVAMMRCEDMWQATRN